MASLRAFLLLTALLPLAACDYGMEETFGSYEATRFALEVDGRPVDLVEGGGSLTLDLYGSSRGGVDGEAYGVFLLPGEWYGRPGFTLRLSYLGTYDIDGERVVFDVGVESSDVLRDDDIVPDGPVLSRSDAEALLNRLVSDPRWVLTEQHLKVNGVAGLGVLPRTGPSVRR